MIPNRLFDYGFMLAFVHIALVGDATFVIWILQDSTNVFRGVELASAVPAVDVNSKFCPTAAAVQSVRDRRTGLLGVIRM
jgi:hypothetical protein